jgi:N-acyl-D-amino-acid deacylase
MIAALLYNATNPGATDQVMDQIESANQRGHALYGQVSCCPLSMEFDMRSPYVFEGFAAWKPAMTAPDNEARKAVYQGGEFRQAVLDELATPAQVRLFNGEWDRLQVLRVAKAENQALEGQSIATIAATMDKEPLDCLLDLAIAEDLETEFLSLLLNYDDEPVGRLLTNPHSSIALSDAGAHLTFFCDVGFGLHLLSHWWRDKQLFSLEAAVHALSGQPAEIYGMADRGRIAPDYAGDLMLFDPKNIGRSNNRRSHDLPGGAPRLVSDPQGIAGVWVNGVRVVDNNGAMIDDCCPGKVLREFSA